MKFFKNPAKKKKSNVSSSILTLCKGTTASDNCKVFIN